MSQLKEALEDLSANFKETDGEIVFALMRTSGVARLCRRPRRSWLGVTRVSNSMMKSMMSDAKSTLHENSSKHVKGSASTIKMHWPPARQVRPALMAWLQRTANISQDLKETYYSLRDLAQLRV